MESNVTIRVRAADKAVAEAAIAPAVAAVKDKIKKDVTVKLDQENVLPASG